MHHSTYCLADEKRLVYSFDGFLIPIAQAFGPTDGGEQQGMFRRDELVGLGKEYMIPTAAVRFPVPAMSTSEIHDQYTEEPTFRDGRASDETARADKLIGDVRGDLRSDAALCYQVCSVCVCVCVGRWHPGCHTRALKATRKRAHSMPRSHARTPTQPPQPHP